MAAPARAARVVRARRAAAPKTELLGERFRGIRPAFGYPACPDHSEKGKLFDLLGAREIGIELTESYAMMPAAAVSGIYLAHPAREVLRGRPDRAGSARRTTRVARENPWYKWKSGCGQISRSGRARRARSCDRSALADAPTVKISKADQAKAVAALLDRSDLGAGWLGGSVKREPADPARTARASTRRSPTSSSRATPMRASPSPPGASSSTRTSRCSRARPTSTRTSQRTISPSSAAASPTSWRKLAERRRGDGRAGRASRPPARSAPSTGPCRRCGAASRRVRCSATTSSSGKVGWSTSSRSSRRSAPASQLSRFELGLAQILLKRAGVPPA